MALPAIVTLLLVVILAVPLAASPDPRRLPPNAGRRRATARWPAARPPIDLGQTCLPSVVPADCVAYPVLVLPDRTTLDRLVRRIVDEVHPLRVVLFGSVARGQATSDSDVDLLVVVPEGTHRRRTAQHLYRVIDRAAVSFDLVVATPGDLERHGDDPGLVYQGILREGRTLYAA